MESAFRFQVDTAPSPAHAAREAYPRLPFPEARHRAARETARRDAARRSTRAAARELRTLLTHKDALPIGVRDRKTDQIQRMLANLEAIDELLASSDEAATEVTEAR